MPACATVVRITVRPSVNVQTRPAMRKTLTATLPRHFPRPAPEQARETPAAPLLLEMAALSIPDVFARLHTSPAGLSETEVTDRRAQHGPNVVGQEQNFGQLRLLGHALVNPLVILLLILATISFLTGDERSGIVMLVMVVLGVLLRFVQEARADAAAARLKAMIHVTATVVRDGKAREVPLAELVPGDVVKLACGDMIPADLRLVTCKDLYVIQSSLTGESFPVEKSEAPSDSIPAPPSGERGNERPTVRQSPLEMKNLCFLGTSVETGSAQGVIVATGSMTYLGAMAGTIMQAPPETSFDRGIRRFTWLMIQFIIVMVPLVFLINGLTKHDWKEAFFFAVAVAVGLTPEMLPMIVSVCLSKGAILLSRRRVIVKRLNAIQNLGAMDVLCTDKTGTLTMDRIILEKYCDVVLKESEEVLILAYLNSYFQTGLKNVVDRAILKHCEELDDKLNIPAHEKVDEIPFDFSRKVMSVVVRLPDGRHRLICKGAPEEVMRRCTDYELEGEIHAMEQMLIADLREEYDELGTDGFRVLGLAYRDMEARSTFSQSDERDLILKGYLAFLDPPRDSAQPAIRSLQDHGVTVKVLTGDNELVSQKICREVGITFDHFLLGRDVEGMSDHDLEETADRTALFCRLSPTHKQRIISGAPAPRARRRLPRRRHQRRPRPAHRRRGHLRGLGRGHRAGISRRHPAGKELAGDGRRGRRGAKGVRQHPQVHPHGRQLELRQHVQRARREHLSAVHADGSHSDPDQQPPLRFLAGADPHRRGRSRTGGPAAAVVDDPVLAVHLADRAVQLGVRLHDLFHDAICLPLLDLADRQH